MEEEHEELILHIFVSYLLYLIILLLNSNIVMHLSVFGRYFLMVVTCFLIPTISHAAFIMYGTSVSRFRDSASWPTETFYFMLTVTPEIWEIVYSDKLELLNYKDRGGQVGGLLAGNGESCFYFVDGLTGTLKGKRYDSIAGHNSAVCPLGGMGHPQAIWFGLVQTLRQRIKPGYVVPHLYNAEEPDQAIGNYIDCIVSDNFPETGSRVLLYGDYPPENITKKQIIEEFGGCPISC